MSFIYSKLNNMRIEWAMFRRNVCAQLFGRRAGKLNSFEEEAVFVRSNEFGCVLCSVVH